MSTDVGYVESHFDISGFTSNLFNENPSTISRFGNLLKAATSVSMDKKQMPLPKIVVVVPENDIINCFKGKGEQNGLTKAFGMVINYVMTEYERGVSSYKEKLCFKCKKDNYPQFLWIQLPYHDNFDDNDERLKFNRSIEDMCKHHTNVSSLELK